MASVWSTHGFGLWITGHPWRVIIATTLMVAVCATGLRELDINDDVRVWFGADDPHLRAFEALENTYTKTDNVFIAVEPTQGDVFTAGTLAALAELTVEAWQVPYSGRVDSLTNFQHIRADADTLIIEDLVTNAEALSPAERANVRRIALAEPMLVNRLVAADATVAGININIIRPRAAGSELAEITAYVRQLAERFRQKHPDLVLHLTGETVINHAFAQATQADMATLVPAMLGAIVLLTWLLLRSLLAPLAVVLMIAMASVTALGLAGWLGIELNPASGNAPTIILTLAVANSIHLLTTHLREMRAGADRTEAMQRALAVNLLPITLTGVTTALGFLSMNSAEAPPLRDLGNMVAIGVLAALLYSLTFLPALMTLLPTAPASVRGGSHTLFAGLADWVLRWRRALLWGFLGIGALLALGIPRIELNDNFIQYFDDRFEVRRASDFVEARLTGLDAIEYSLAAGATGGINAPDYLAAVEGFSQWLRGQPGVVHVGTLTDTLKRLNRSLHGDDPAYYRLPRGRELAAQYLLLYEMSVPYGLDLNNQIDVDRSATRVTVTLRGQSAKDLRRFDRAAQAWLADNALPTMATAGSGLSLMFAHISRRNIDGMLGGSFLALVMISGLLMLALRSVRLGGISLIPNLLPALMTFGIWGIVVGEVGLAGAVLVGITLGIVVDDTVHLLSHYLDGRRHRGLAPAESVRHAFISVGPALSATTAILTVGFGILALSGYRVTADMGLLVAVTLALALVLDLLFLPPLLLSADRGHD